MRLLVVDDDFELRNFLQSALKAECFEVDLAKDGEEGLFLARTNDYDLIILDSNLPKTSGLDVCQKIREEKINVPILILSVVLDVENKTKLLDIGADDYLTKPFQLAELLSRIRALLRRPKKIEPEILKIGDLSLNSKTDQVKRGNREIYLTAKEFMLLEYLMRNPGMVLSRAMILEHVWDMNADPFSNVIEVHIANLRQKIDGPGKADLIKTVPGRGYKIGTA